MSDRYELKKALRGSLGLGDLLAIRWLHQLEHYKPGDCAVMVKEEEREEDNGEQYNSYMEPMTLEQIHTFITTHVSVLGSHIHDCHGLIRGDEIIFFDTPIQVRNHS